MLLNHPRGLLRPAFHCNPGSLSLGLGPTRSFRARLGLRGKPVLLIVAREGVLEPDPASAITARLQLEPPTPQMLDAVLGLQFPRHRQPACRIDLHGLSDLQLARVFAAESAAAAYKLLQGLTPAETSGREAAPALRLAEVHGQAAVTRAARK